MALSLSDDDLAPAFPRIPRWLRFGLVGGLNTAIDVGVFAALLYVFDWAPVPAHVAGFLVAVANSYVLNKVWTFEAAGWSRGALVDGLRFLLVATSALGISTAVVWASLPFVDPLLAKLVAVVVTFVWSYTLSSRWVFGRR
ncbi:MAG: GtrA family protein [Pseudomonadota bacterium]